jgi:hypothetical protein
MSAPVKGTPCARRFGSAWSEWEKQKDLEGRLRTLRRQRIEVLDQREQYRAKEKAVPQATREQLEAVEFQFDVGDLERVLRDYERQPWKAQKDQARGRSLQAARFLAVARAAEALLQRAGAERLAAARQTWPGLPPARLEGQDLLTCELAKAERVVGTLFKTAHGAATARRKLREVRLLAGTYPLQQRLFEVSTSLVQASQDELLVPTQGAAPPPDRAAVARQWLDVQLSLGRARSQLMQTWVEYQRARLELYQELKRPPP